MEPPRGDAPPPAGGVASPAHASFRVTVTGLTITIANHTRGAGRFAWAFGDGTASSATSPDHTYAGPGTYTVTLIATSTSGAFDRQATQVTVGR